MRADSRPSPGSTASAADSSPGSRSGSPKHRPHAFARASYTSRLTLTSTVSIVPPRVNHRCIALQPGPQQNATNRYVSQSTSAVAVPPWCSPDRHCVDVGVVDLQSGLGGVRVQDGPDLVIRQGDLPGPGSD